MVRETHDRHATATTFRGMQPDRRSPAGMLGLKSPGDHLLRERGLPATGNLLLRRRTRKESFVLMGLDLLRRFIPGKA